MSDQKSPTPSQNEKGNEEAEEVPSAVNFVTKNTFRSQSNSPVTQATVEDLWRRALKQEADFRTRYWAMIAGVVIVSVVAILAVVAPLAAQRDTFSDFENRMTLVEKKTHPGNLKSSALTVRKAPGSGEYLSAMRSSKDCSNIEPLTPDSLGPGWSCASRDWDQWEASNGTLLTYFCSRNAACSVMMSGKCSTNRWTYININTHINCDCSRTAPNVLPMSTRRRRQRFVRTNKQSVELTEHDDWKSTHCSSDPPPNWGCAVSDWSSDRKQSGFNPKAKGYVVNYTCRSRSRGCTVTRTLECGENGSWKVVFTSSIVNDCICGQESLLSDDWL